jgi:hypothetical protein
MLAEPCIILAINVDERALHIATGDMGKLIEEFRPFRIGLGSSSSFHHFPKRATDLLKSEEPTSSAEWLPPHTFPLRHPISKSKSSQSCTSPACGRGRGAAGSRSWLIQSHDTGGRNARCNLHRSLPSTHFCRYSDKRLRWKLWTILRIANKITCESVLGK